METQPSDNLSSTKMALSLLRADERSAFDGKTPEDFRNLLLQFRPPWLDDLLTKLTSPTGKESFLVSKGSKYINVLTENIALFYVRYESTMIRCFDNQGYQVNYSLEQIQSLLPEKRFYRLNRQYLINFDAVKDVEHYFSRKLLVNTVVPTDDKLVVPKGKVSQFMHWLDNR